MVGGWWVAEAVCGVWRLVQWQTLGSKSKYVMIYPRYGIPIHIYRRWCCSHLTPLSVMWYRVWGIGYRYRVSGIVFGYRLRCKGGDEDKGDRHIVDVE